MKKWTSATAFFFLFVYFYYLDSFSEKNYQYLSKRVIEQQKRLNLLKTQKNLLQNRIFDALVSEKLNHTKRLLLSDQNITQNNEILVQISPPITQKKVLWYVAKYKILMIFFVLLAAVLLGGKFAKDFSPKNLQSYIKNFRKQQKYYPLLFESDGASPKTVSQTSLETSLSE